MNWWQYQSGIVCVDVFVDYKKNILYSLRFMHLSHFDCILESFCHFFIPARAQIFAQPLQSTNAKNGFNGVDLWSKDAMVAMYGWSLICFHIYKALRCCQKHLPFGFNIRSSSMKYYEHSHMSVVLVHKQPKAELKSHMCDHSSDVSFCLNNFWTSAEVRIYSL